MSDELSKSLEIIMNLEQESPKREDVTYENINVGDWFWYKNSKEERQRNKQDPIGADEEKLVCVTHKGSNYVLIKTGNQRWDESIRIHADSVGNYLTREYHAQEIIEKNISHHKNRVGRQLDHVQRIQSEFGIDDPTKLLSHQTPTPTGGNELMVMSESKDISVYKKNLKMVQKHLLPKLFKRIKHGHEILAQWMSTQTLDVKTQIGTLDGILDSANKQIFNVSLYAGLAEHSTKVKSGEPAEVGEKIHIMQRLMYMDEESLLDYDHGGMEYKNIKQFDAWLSRENNFERLLPFEKCVVAFQVRRNAKERRDLESGLAGWMIRMKLEAMDAYTFLYVRNGEQLHRLSIDDMDFDEKLFPDDGHFNFVEPMMGEYKYSSSDRHKVMRLSEYEEIVRNNEPHEKIVEQLEPKHRKWQNENDGPYWDSPYYKELNKAKGAITNVSDYKRVDYDNLYFDDIMGQIKDDMDKFNKTSLLIQGLLDRSDVFHPHPPIKTWDAESFHQYIKLVYDSSMCLDFGDPPDIDAYIQKCNDQADKDSVWWGANDAWGEMHYENETKPVWTDNGPKNIRKASKYMPRVKKAKFSYEIERARWNRWDNSPINRHFTCSTDKLFNISAYKLGDYKQFFQDHRTRRQYTKWAKMLLKAEEYHYRMMMEAKNPKNGGKDISDGWDDMVEVENEDGSIRLKRKDYDHDF